MPLIGISAVQSAAVPSGTRKTQQQLPGASGIDSEFARTVRAAARKEGKVPLLSFLRQSPRHWQLSSVSEENCS